eukprot:12480396-Alexandrium_andersonii.AAC.1
MRGSWPCIAANVHLPVRGARSCSLGRVAAAHVAQPHAGSRLLLARPLLLVAGRAPEVPVGGGGRADR